jgi:hypothetical protein
MRSGSGSPQQGARWFREVRETLELLGRVSGELATQSAVTVQVALFQRLGVKDESEVLAMIGQMREVEGLNEHQLAEQAARSLAWYRAHFPERWEELALLLEGHAPGGPTDANPGAIS